MNNKNIGIGCGTVLWVIFFILFAAKVFGVVNISWWIVVSPLILSGIAFIAFLIFITIVFVLAFIAKLLD